MVEYLWYTPIGNEAGLNQGDFIFSCPILEPLHDLNKEETVANLTQYDVIIMSQTCDILQKKLDIVLVCPFWSLSELESKNAWFRSGKNKEKLRRGEQPNYHLLNGSDVAGFKLDYLVVNFRSVFGVPYLYLENYIQRTPKRLRLNSPYKEHLSQSFARFFMRVGLPIDIKPFV